MQRNQAEKRRGRAFATLRSGYSRFAVCSERSVHELVSHKTIVQTCWIALDGGILISWLSFLCMDIITKHFGARASNMIALFATAVNLLVSLVFYIASVIPSSADDYTALNEILGGTWFILLGSTVAFLVSAAVNNGLNGSIGRIFRKIQIAKWLMPPGRIYPPLSANL